MEKRLTMILACLFLSLGMALAQTSVTGTVVSHEDGQPVIGATIRVAGSDAGTVTDIDGKFTVNAPLGTELTVSYIGMQTVTVKAAKNLVIELFADDTSLEELVVTGYGSARKLGTIAGSVTTVGGDKLTNKPIANIGDAMQGQVAGLQVFTSSGEPSAQASMRIRGQSSINAASSPLIILDGSEVSSETLLAINPNDIENMTVLKDASSTAIYGARAASGVIVITTKRGKYGEAPTVSLSAQYGISQVAGDFADMMDANEWLQLQEIMTPSLANDANFQARKAYYRKYNIGTDWHDVFLGGTAPTYQVDASVRGGSENVAYLVSFNHYDAEGLMPNSSMRREAIRANIESNVAPWLKIGANSSLSYTKTSSYLLAGNSQTSTNMNNLSFAARAYRPDQSRYEILGLNTNDYANSTFDGYGDKLVYYDLVRTYDPFVVSDYQPQWQNTIRIYENAFVNINPIKGLNIRSAVGLEAADTRYTFVQYNTTDLGADIMQNNYTGTRIERSQWEYEWTVTNTAEYKFNLARKHDFTVLLGQETTTEKQDAFGVTAMGLVDNRLMLLSSAVQTGVQVPTQSIIDQVRNSWFGMLNYSYGDRYFIDLSIRRDGSSLFAEDHRWGTFGAGAFMWNITNEKFMAKTRKWLNDLQFRISYGSTGNSGIAAYTALGLVGTGGTYDNTSGLGVANPANPNLTWETVKTLNVGVTTKMFDRLSLNLEYYHKTTSDMLLSIPYSYTTGFSGGWGNVGEMVNQGIEFSLSADIIRNKDWYWMVSVNGNYNHNEITKLYQNTDSYTVAGTGTRYEVGHPYGEYYLVRRSRIDPADGQIIWLDKNGNETKQYSTDNAVMTGKQMIAPWSGGLNTTLAWKGLQLDVQFTGAFGRYILNSERQFTENPIYASTLNQSKVMLDMWQQPGDITDIPAANVTNVGMDTHFLENASYVRLKMLQLSYTLPKKWMDATHILKSAKVFFVARNLFTIVHSDFTGYDPEVDSNVTVGNYPNTRQFSFGAQITF